MDKSLAPMVLRGVPNVFEYVSNLLEKDHKNSPFVYGTDAFSLNSMLKRGFLFPETKATIEAKGIYERYEVVWPDGFPYMYYGVPQMEPLCASNKALHDRFLRENNFDKILDKILSMSVEGYARNAAVESYLRRFGVVGIDYDDAMHLANNFVKMQGRLGNIIDEVHTLNLLSVLSSSGLSLCDLYNLSVEAINYSGVYLYFGSNLPSPIFVEYGVETDMECLIFTQDVLRPYHLDAIRMSVADLGLFQSLS